ncbi:hypothetical protein AMECASPLE_030855 [Ameca splendens]|uniref:Uncharacterized protein n=1 Tax=Ameca splendens TaxID=208324 RepID=A0ABV1ADZ0_9TELE
MTVILDLHFAYSVWISAAVSIVYTLLGGLYSVAYIIQLTLVSPSLLPPEDAVCLFIKHSPVNLLCGSLSNCHSGNPSCSGRGCGCLHS